MRLFRAVVFDLDDTLYLEADYVMSGMKRVAEHCAEQYGVGRAETFVELERLFRADPRRPIFDAWLSDRQYPAVDVANLVEVYRSHEPQIRMERETELMLRSLRPEYALGLVSDGRAAAQRKKVKALQLETFLDAIVLSDEIGHDAWKPDSRPFIAVAAALGVNSEECVYFADNPTKDFVGARRAGFASVRVRLPGSLHRNAEPADAAHDPDAEISSLSLISVTAAIAACGGDLGHGHSSEVDLKSRPRSD